MLGISTAWRSEIWDSGADIVEEILNLGVNALELEYRITRPMLEEILPLIEEERISVVSLHNIFPLPGGIPKGMATGEFVSLSSPLEEDRKAAVGYAVGTMDWAERFGAKAIVLHLGKVRMEGVMGFFLRAYDEGKIHSEEKKDSIERHKEIRAELGKPLLESTLKSLETLTREAEKRKVFLGIENRYNIHEFPSSLEFGVIFREFAGTPVRYWHDIGHATAQENLGLVGKGELLENFGKFLVGVHLHGCKGYNDHYAPGSGEEDYCFLKRYLRPETIRVVETHHRATREELIQGLKFLEKKGVA